MLVNQLVEPGAEDEECGQVWTTESQIASLRYVNID